ncbi:MAG TPA: hypothetical protein VGP94_08435 [Tepidisphaeraceae bacterium]|nr:hypothetical protein [Tepidisphaeraceae bacterium]
MHRTRQILVATVLTTALITGAAKGAQAAPAAAKPHPVSVARRLAAKLTTSFRQVVPAARLAPLRVSNDTSTVVAIVPPTSAPSPIVSFDSSPALYPLPPPTL